MAPAWRPWVICDHDQPCVDHGLGALLPHLAGVLIERVEQIRDAVWLVGASSRGDGGVIPVDGGTMAWRGVR